MKDRDVNAFAVEETLFVMPDGTDWTGWAGVGIFRYDVSKLRDVRNLGSRVAYRVRCTLRLRVFRSPTFNLAHDTPLTWAGYPAALINVVQPAAAPESPSLDIKLTAYSPKTVNTSVSADVAQVKGSDLTLIRQHTAGSSTTVTNSFGANVGASGEGGPSAGLSFEHAETSDTRNELMTGANRGSSSQLSDSASMTIKDWAAFARLGISTDGVPNVTWVWAQEYPWDAVLMRPHGQDDTEIDVPTDVQYRMSQSGYVQPPSHLSQMGFEFVCESTWLVTPDSWSPTQEPELAVTHSGVFWQATHDAADVGANVTITPNSTDYPQDGNTIVHNLPLERYALIPVSVTGGGSNAMVGFAANEIEASDDTAFAACSRMGNLYVLGSGFVQTGGYGYGGSGMTVELDAGGRGTITLFFKVLDREEEYDLALKHWITGTRPAQVSVWANPDPSLNPDQVIGTPPTLRRYVTEHEGEGGDDNVTMISLRSLAFGSADYHDDLNIGLNRVVIEISPSADNPDAPGAGDLYVLRALSIA